MIERVKAEGAGETCAGGDKETMRRVDNADTHPERKRGCPDKATPLLR
jgi:hypothetical protein